MIPSHHHSDAEILRRLGAGDKLLKDALTDLVSHVLTPLPDNFTPPERTPWGGRKILTDLKVCLKIENCPEIIGESWEVSAHPRFPSCFSFVCDGHPMTVSLPALETIFPEVHLPYLVKFLNSGSDKPRGNLSVQVHPSPDDPNLQPGEHPKTEAWIIIDAEAGAGVYLGLKEGVTRPRFEAMLRQGQDATRLLNFVEVKPGDVYFIPSGTLHAIGAGILLLEPQETSETTYRVYDLGRLDSQGRTRPLHIDRAMDATYWDGPRGEALVAALRRLPQVISGNKGGVVVERLVAESVFDVSRIKIFPGQEFCFDASQHITSFVILSGEISVWVSGKCDGTFLRGQSLIFPQSLKNGVIQNRGKSFSEIFQITAP